MYAALDGQNVDFTYNSSSFFGAGKVGCVTTVANTTFDDFTYLRATPHDPACPGWNTTADVTLNTGAGTLTVTGNIYGGAAVSNWAGDDGERSERECAATGIAGAEARVRHTRGPRGASTTRATCGYVAKADIDLNSGALALTTIGGQAFQPVDDRLETGPTNQMCQTTGWQIIRLMTGWKPVPQIKCVKQLDGRSSG